MNFRNVGHLRGARDPINIEWDIDNFVSRPALANFWDESPMFFFCDASWYIRLYPNGNRADFSEGYVGVYVVRGDSGPPVAVIMRLILKKTDGAKEVLCEGTYTFETKDTEWGNPKAIRRLELIEQKSKFMPSGVLTIVCSLECDKTKGTKKLLSDLKGLADGGEESDMIVKVQFEEFRLHRAIMAARSPVFKAMFKRNMKEKATGIVSIKDCDSEIFRTFVHYLYTGSEDEVHRENVVRVYKVADKYQVDELKASCVDIMKSTWSVDTFCDTLALAMQYEEVELIEQAVDFLSENGSDIIGREDWQNLMRYNMKRVSELLRQAFVRNTNKLGDAAKK